MSEMNFEYMLRQYFGDKAFHTAGLAHYKLGRSKWFKKLEMKLFNDINNIETSERHKSMLMSDIEELFQSLKTDEARWVSVFIALTLISRFLGYDFQGSKLNTLSYYQKPTQYYTQVIFEGGDVLQEHYDSKDVISQRAEVAKELKNKGLSTFRISQILSISEYKVRQLLNAF